MAVTSVSSESNRPWDVASGALATTNTWEGFKAPTWVRCVTLRNSHSTATLYVGQRGINEGASAPGVAQKAALAAGESMSIFIGGGRGKQTDNEARTLHLHSPDAGCTYVMLLEAAAN